MSAGVYQPVMIVGPLPPPTHGAAVITARMAEAIAARDRVVVLNIAPDGMRRGIAYHWTRLRRVVAALLRVLAGGWGATRGAVYLSAAGGRGLFYNVALAVGVRALRRQLYVHHHSFAYVDRRDWKMALLTRVAGRRACHIVLCPKMALGLRRNYGVAARTQVLSNAAFYQPSAETTPRRHFGARLRIGFLSNLQREKGLDLVFATVVAAANSVAKLVLAGDPVDKDAADMIAAARAKLGPLLDYRGAAYGNDKIRFFADIDVFLFPTRYVDEAEPTVVYEALSAGVPVIAYGRGCIHCQVPKGAGLVVKPGDDFVSSARAQIEHWARNAADWELASRSAIEGARTAHEQARTALTEVLAALRGVHG